MLSEGIRNVFNTFLKMPSRYKRVVTDVGYIALLDYSFYWLVPSYYSY